MSVLSHLCRFRLLLRLLLLLLLRRRRRRRQQRHQQQADFDGQKNLKTKTKNGRTSDNLVLLQIDPRLSNKRCPAPAVLAQTSAVRVNNLVKVVNNNVTADSQGTLHTERARSRSCNSDVTVAAECDVA